MLEAMFLDQPLDHHIEVLGFHFAAFDFKTAALALCGPSRFPFRICRACRLFNPVHSTLQLNDLQGLYPPVVHDLDCHLAVLSCLEG
jgi:hypothetical protein